MENTTENPTTTTRIAIKWGLISGMILIIFTLVFFLTELILNPSLNWINSVLSLIVLGVTMYIGMGEFKKSQEGFMSYGQGLGIGVMLGGISGAVSSAFYVLYNTLIDTTIMKRMAEIQDGKMIEQWEKQGLTQQQIDSALETTHKVTSFFQNPGILFVFGMLMSIFFAFLISLLVAAFQSKNRTTLD